MGYTKDEVAAVTKIYGVIMTLAGAFVGGALAMRFGVMKVLMLGAALSAGSNLLFAWLGSRGDDVNALIFVISADNLQRHCIGGLYCLPVEPDPNNQLFSDAVRAVQFDDAAPAEISGWLFRQICGHFWLHALLHRNRDAGPAGADSGVAGVAHEKTRRCVTPIDDDRRAPCQECFVLHPSDPGRAKLKVHRSMVKVSVYRNFTVPTSTLVL